MISGDRHELGVERGDLAVEITPCAICPQHGKGAGLVLPSYNTQAMSLHLAEIATEVALGAHAVVLLD